MKKAFIYVTIVLLAIAVLIGVSISSYGKSKGLLKESNDTQSSVEQSLPWLEIITGKVFELQTDEKTVKAKLATGDYIIDGMILKTDVSGKAIIHYPEGSELRLERETLVKIEKGSFNHQSDSLKVRVELVIGRVWSKIIELATPDSEWEVKTSNAVATVRGTAFGMEVDTKQKTKIIGSENTVQIGVRNAKMKSLAETNLVVTKDKIIEIDNDIADKVLALKKTSDERISSTDARQFIIERTIVVTDLKDGWIKDSRDRDDKIRAKIQDLNNGSVNKKDIINKSHINDNVQAIDGIDIKSEPLSREVRNKLQEDLRKEFQEKTKQVKEPVMDIPIQEPIVRKIIQTKERIDITPKSLPIDFSTAKLEVVSEISNLNIVEGTEIQFSASLVLPDGTRKDVTSEVTWNVVGYMGRVTSSGKFISEIGPEESDSEFSLGSITAILKNTDGVALKGFSKLITVSHKISDVLISPQDIGGQ